MYYYISDDFILVCIGLVMFYVIGYYYNKRGTEKMLSEERTRLAGLTNAEREAEELKKKENDDLMRGVNRYPNL